MAIVMRCVSEANQNSCKYKNLSTNGHENEDTKRTAFITHVDA
jgi:hypothetical protein